MSVSWARAPSCCGLWRSIPHCGALGTDSIPASVLTSEKSFIANPLYRRFYRLPEGVNLRLDSVYHRFDNTRTFTALGDRYEKFGRFESVRVADWNATIHFLHDPSIGDKSG